ncbi:MAG: PD-(D/E)XK nuclease family protein [Treponema sp.]|jgi:hypothetical protein|nr:PD-(D/E)XK nuclease family protein [Treponema sp.]
MNIVIETIKKHINEQNVHFVFPSKIASERWGRKICVLGIAGSVAGKRFISWDEFKEEVILREERERVPVSSVTRRLFAEFLAQKNAMYAAASLPKAEGYPFLSIIPPQYADRGNIFSASIAKALPALKHWQTLKKLKASLPDDPEDRDYITAAKEYVKFLKAKNLFEPSWEKIDIKKSDVRYIIFFPELMEDFAEYDELLKEPAFSRICLENLETEKPVLYKYQSVREELRSAALEIRRLHFEEAVPFEDMAISVPDLENMEHGLLRQFKLYQIPAVFRAGKALGETGAGRFFSLAKDCQANRFSFTAVKALVLNDHIPWKDRDANKALIGFGIKYNCVSGYGEGKDAVDIWKEAFKNSGKGEKKLEKYYLGLRDTIEKLTLAENFKEIRKYYFVFKNIFLDMEKITEEDNAILGRCIEELGGLVEIEEQWNDPAFTPRSPFSFFLSILKEKQYVQKEKAMGVNIFKWRVASAAPFAAHFILNASQDAAAVIYRPLNFLRIDKRKALGIDDVDATPAFFRLCNTGAGHGFSPRLRISSSVQTFSGWTIPHSFFEGEDGEAAEAPSTPADPYIAERCFWAGQGTKEEFPKELFYIQKTSFNAWRGLFENKKKEFSFLNSPVPETPGIKGLLKKKIWFRDTEHPGKLIVSPTKDLNYFFNCPLLWLYSRIFEADEFFLEARLLDDISLGLLYHGILEELFEKIKTEDHCFKSAHLEDYKNWAYKITSKRIEEHPAFNGPLATPLVLPQAEGMWKKICALLDIEAKHFDGFSVTELEYPVYTARGDIIIKGTIDRVSVSPDGAPFIFDYKTGEAPKQIDISKLDEQALTEFQMPLYVKLYEESIKKDFSEKAPEVEGAFFYSINKGKINAVVGTEGAGKNKCSRSAYQAFLDASEVLIRQFHDDVKSLNMVPKEINFKKCAECLYRTCCRTVYSLNSKGE